MNTRPGARFVSRRELGRGKNWRAPGARAPMESMEIKTGGQGAAPLPRLGRGCMEVIQPQLPLRLPCYDFFLIAALMFDLPK